MADGNRRADMRSLVRGVFGERAKGPMLTVNLLRQHWPAVVGAELAARTWPQRMERGTLWIAAPDATWVYELQFFKAELLSSVQTFLENASVQDLRFRVGEAPHAPSDPAASEPAAPPEVQSQPPSEAQTAPEPPPNSAARLSARLRAGRQAERSPSSTPAPSGAAPPANLDTPRDAGEETSKRLAESARVIRDPALRAVFQRSLTKQQRGRRAPEESGPTGATVPPDMPDGEEEP